MQKTMGAIASNAVARAVLSILFGLFLAFWPETAAVTVVYVFAAYLAIVGVFSIIYYVSQRKKSSANSGTIFLAVLLLVLAVVFFLLPEAVAGLLAIVFGALLVASGIVNMFLSIGLRAFTGRIWIGLLIFSLLLAIGGVIIIVNPFGAAVTFVLFLGILFVVKGIIDLIVYIFVRRKDKSQQIEISKS